MTWVSRGHGREFRVMHDIFSLTIPSKVPFFVTTVRLRGMALMRRTRILCMYEEVSGILCQRPNRRLFNLILQNHWLKRQLQNHWLQAAMLSQTASHMESMNSAPWTGTLPSANNDWYHTWKLAYALHPPYSLETTSIKTTNRSLIVVLSHATRGNFCSWYIPR
jgi:hypothetical protein